MMIFLLLTAPGSRHFKRFWLFSFINKSEVVIAGNANADVVINDMTFRDRCIQIRKHADQWKLLFGSEQTFFDGFYSLATPGFKIRFLDLKGWALNFVHEKKRPLLSGLGIVLIFFLMNLRVPNKGAPRVVRLPVHEGLQVELASSVTKIGFRVPKEISGQSLLKYYLVPNSSIGKLEWENSTTETDVHWPGQRYTAIPASIKDNIFWLTVYLKNSNELTPDLNFGVLTLKHLHASPANGVTDCRDLVQNKSYTDWERVQRMAHCPELQSELESLRQSISTTLEGLRFEFVRAKNLGNDFKAYQQLKAMLQVLPDPLDPRTRSTQYLMGRYVHLLDREES